MRQSNHFYIRFLIFLVTIVIVDEVAGIFFNDIRKAALEHNPYKENQKLSYMVEKVQSDVVVIGASDASHHYISKMIQDSIGMSVYNLGQDGCFFIYQNSAINLMLNRYSPKVIIWEVGADALSGNLDKKHEYQNISALYPYYDNTYCKGIINDKDSFQKYRMLSKMYRYNSTLRRYLFSLYKTADGSNGGYEPLDNYGYQYPTILHEIISENVCDRNVQMLSATIKNCENHNVKLIFSFSPKYIDKYIDEEAFHTIQYKKLEEIARNECIPIIRYDPNNFKDSTLFKDAGHMNDNGAKLFMHFYIPELKETLE